MGSEDCDIHGLLTFVYLYDKTITGGDRMDNLGTYAMLLSLKTMLDNGMVEETKEMINKLIQVAENMKDEEES